VTRAEAAARLRTLGTVAVWNLAVPAFIRSCRDGWLIFLLPSQGHAWYGTRRGGRGRGCSPASIARRHTAGLS
jgi:hypothetical protein